MKHYAILKLEKLSRTRLQEIKKRCEHVNRKDYAENVNQDLSHLNKCIIGDPTSDWIQLYKKRLKELSAYKGAHAVKLRADAVVGIEVVASMSFEASSQLDIEAWCRENNKWMIEHFGEENVLHGVLHMDEASGPHIHYFITPVNEQGRFNASEVAGGRKKFIDRQTSYAEAMEQFGLQRGLKNLGMKYKEVRDLYTETSNMVNNLPMIEEDETPEEYYKRVNDLYRSLHTRNCKLEQDVERYEITREYAQTLQDEKEKLLAENRDLQDQLDNMTIGGVVSVKNLNTAFKYHPDQQTVQAQINYLKESFEEWETFGAEMIKEQELAEQERKTGFE